MHQASAWVTLFLLLLLNLCARSKQRHCDKEDWVLQLEFSNLNVFLTQFMEIDCIVLSSLFILTSLTAKDHNRQIEGKVKLDLMCHSSNQKQIPSVQSCWLRKSKLQRKTHNNPLFNFKSRTCLLFWDANELSTMTPTAKHKQSRVDI